MRKCRPSRRRSELLQRHEAGASVCAVPKSDAVTYDEGLDGLSETMSSGFFVCWPHAATPAQHLDILRGSSHVVTATSQGEVVGFINALSDGVMAAFIPLLEVRTDHQGLGIGSELVRRIFGLLAPLYFVDIVCDPEVAPFYERLGMQRLTGMAWRNRDAAVVSQVPD